MLMRLHYCTCMLWICELCNHTVKHPFYLTPRVTGEATEVHWTHCHVQGTSMWRLLICDVANYHVRKSHGWIIVNITQITQAGEFKCCSVGFKTHSILPRKHSLHHYPTMTSLNYWWEQFQILALLSVCCSRNQNSTGQVMFFPLSLPVRFQWTCANCGLRTLLSTVVESYQSLPVSANQYLLLWPPSTYGIF